MTDQAADNKLNTGLTAEQIREKTQAGQINGEQLVKTKSYSRIIRDNLFTLFNLINVILLVCILISGSYKNALFFLVVIWNFLIGTIQEIRAKKTIDKLTLLSLPRVYALRDGKVEEIQVKDIVLGEIMQLKDGCQICADAVVLQGSCQVNESLLTGESVPILKKEGDHLLSGSFLISGRVLAEAEHVGADNYVNKITQDAKYFKKPDSVIMKSVRMIVKVLAIAIIPLAGLQVWNNFFRTPTDFSADMVRTVATVSSMIPGGLVLLVSIVLAVSVVRLSVHKTLVQDLDCVENLARVDMLLLDKTGTITEGVLRVEQVTAIEGGPVSGTEQAQELLKYYMDHSEDDNSTARAVREYTDSLQLSAAKETEYRNTEASAVSIPFSSERKWGLVQREDQVIVLGAPEYVMKEGSEAFQDLLVSYNEQGKRALLLAVSGDVQSVRMPEEGDYVLPSGLRAAALVILSDRVRKEAPDTFDFFEREEVTIKVITGDAPLTASMIAREAGLNNAEKYLDASGIPDTEDIGEMASEYTVFGRVTPKQKCQIVKALQEQGHTVAMIGDGANDVLALKEADCSVAMQSGSDAARNVANMVLLDSNFASLPLVVAEGRKSINNLQRSAALYLTKTTYSFIFAVFFIFAVGILYPFENIQVTLIGAVTIGIPSFFLALEPLDQRIRNNFLWNVFRLALPSGILEAGALILLLYLLRDMPGIQSAQISTAGVYLMLILGILTVFLICGKLNWWKGGLILLLILIAAGASLLFPGLFSLAALTWGMWKIILLISAGFFVIHFLICRVLIPYADKKKA